MPVAWRIVKERYAASAFDGEGARLYGGRWTSPGTRVVYVSETRALAMLEVLAGLGDVGPLGSYVLLSAEFDDALVTDGPVGGLPAKWRASPPPAAVQEVGDEWIREGSSAVLSVPSVIVPTESNYLLDPRHRDFPRIVIGEPSPVTFDPRLVR